MSIHESLLGLLLYVYTLHYRVTTLKGKKRKEMSHVYHPIYGYSLRGKGKQSREWTSLCLLRHVSKDFFFLCKLPLNPLFCCRQDWVTHPLLKKREKKIRDRKIEFDINGGELIIIIIIFYRSTSGRN